MEKIKVTDEALTKESLEKYSKEELVDFILSRKHTMIQQKQKNVPFTDEKGVTHKKEHQGKKKKKEFDFSKVSKTRIALKFSYIGKAFSGGLVVQINTDDTVEARLFDALRKCFLIDPKAHISSCVYTRCGRTDKGVSALANVCTLMVRYLPAGDYCFRINHCLPPEIRILAYAEIPPQFDSRFSCIYREYKYFFHQDQQGVLLDIEKMQQAARLFLGMHDFRNFCKKDNSAPGASLDDDEEQNFLRRIYQF